MPARKKPSPPAPVKSAGTQGPAVDAFSETLLVLKRKMEENLDQLSLVQGVLEELCERQEALAAWQMEFAKRTVTLGEAQWRALEGLAGQSAFAGFRSKADLMLAHKNAAAESASRASAGAFKGTGPEASASEASFVDSLDEATDYLGGLSSDLARRREVRRRVHSERVSRRQMEGTAQGSAKAPAKNKASNARSTRESSQAEKGEKPTVDAPESILVLPEKTDFH